MVGYRVELELDLRHLQILATKLILQLDQLVLKLQSNSSLILQVTLHACLHIPEFIAFTLQDIVDLAQMVHLTVLSQICVS